MKRVIVTGSRNWPKPEIVWSTLDYIKHWKGDFQLIHGGCPTGADHFAEEWAQKQGWETRIFEADWDRLGKAAGPLRNSEMVRSGANYCIGFPDPSGPSRGTWDCLNKAEKQNIQTWWIDIEGRATLL